MSKSFMNPVHPGKVLQIEFMEPLGVKAYSLAKALDMPRSSVEAVVRGRRNISAEMALRLSRIFGNSPNYWLNLQSYYDLETAREKIGEDIENLTPLLA